MLLNKYNSVEFWGPGVRPSECLCKEDYVIISDGTEQGFNNFVEADNKFSQITGQESLISKKIKYVS